MSRKHRAPIPSVEELEQKVKDLEDELEFCRQASDDETIRADNEATRADDAEGELDELRTTLRAFKGLLQDV